jgi:hypothetical protein
MVTVCDRTDNGIKVLRVAYVDLIVKDPTAELGAYSFLCLSKFLLRLALSVQAVH